MSNVRFSRQIAASAAFTLAMLAGMSQAGAVRDAVGREVVVRDASRIVSIGGAVTEILYAIGKSDRVVAVDTTSLYPPEALRTKPNVGYFRQLSPEGVIGLAPSVIIAADGAGPREAVAVLETASIPFVRVPDHFDGDGIIEKIRIVAAATGAEKQAVCLEEAVERDLTALASLRSRIKKPARAMFILSFMNGRPMVAGRGTAADGIMRMSGAENVFGDFEGYKIVNDEAIVAAAPEVVLAMQRAGLDLDAPQVFGHAAFRETPAARDQRFFAMEGLYMLGFGPRTARAARDLSLSLYPELEGAKLPSDNSSGGKEPCQP
jgi:iron complex transport system substrate-binding protein